MSTQPAHLDALFARAKQLNRECFGHDALRTDQIEAVRAVLAGRDVLITLPTGGGKSLVYQLPALVLEGLTLVVSPLIALMQDQVEVLRQRGVAATFVNSSLSRAERLKRLDAAADNKLDLLFVTPERFRSQDFIERLERISVTRLAVDEAHCISEWGHDFRPDYWRLGEYRARLNDPPTVALTATATPDVARDIVQQLRLEDPLLVRRGIERENLFLTATRVEREEDKLPLLAERLSTIGGAGIVYSTLIRDLERLHDELRRRGTPSLVYHGKLSAEERRSMQRRFMQSPDAIVLATNAFGMGIDKADIRFVIHAQVPRTLEAWTQEVGRAGRDGAPAWCELIAFEEDLAVQQNFIGWGNPDREYLLGVVGVLESWGERIAVKDLDDLRSELLVKNRSDQRVGLCLKWLEVLGVTRGSFEGNDLELIRELDPEELPEFVGSDDKLRRDLQALLSTWTFASAGLECRRALLARHFELPEPEQPCGACDHCTDAAEWRATKMPARVRPTARESNVAPDAEASAPSGEWQRGDWVRVDGRHMGQVVRVDGKRGSQSLLIESASDMRRRRVNPKRQRVERLKSGEQSS